MLFELDNLEDTNKKVPERPIERKERKPKINVSYEDLIHLVKKLKSKDYEFFTSEKFPHGFVFFDFEIFEYDWLVVLIDPIHKTKDIICNNRAALKEYFEYHKDMIWVGYNNTRYDNPILKTILLGGDPKEMSDGIINENKNPNQINPYLNKIKLLSYDVASKLESLKLLEAYMGHNIQETEVSFDIDRPLKLEEIQQTMRYCIHDVEETIEVFIKRINDFNASMNLIEMFDLPLRNIQCTKGQLTAMIIGCTKQEHDDEFDITIVPTIKLNKYKYVQDWFIEAAKKKSYSEKLETMVCGIPHQFGWGGVHGAPDTPIHTTGKIYHVDVTSYYPSLMIVYDLLTRNCKDKNKFKEVYDTRVALKKAGKKKEQEPYKIILNSTYGICKDKFSQAYDPLMANNVVVNGQLMLLDLLEKLEGHAEILQSNTDGIICKIPDDERSEKVFKHICHEWMLRTKMGLGFDEIKSICQANVNNYVFMFNNEKLERKGFMVMELNDLSYNLPIVNEAMVEYITKGTPVETTVNSCDELIKFQSVFRITNSYKYAYYNDEYLYNKTYRVFASKNSKDGTLLKCKYPIGEIVGENGNTYKGEKFQNCPDHCFINNDNVNGLTVPENLDRKWYIELAKKRLNESFGYSLAVGNALF